MHVHRRFLFCLAILAVAALATLWPERSLAFVEIPYTLGKVINDSTNILVLRVEKVNKENNQIIFRKVEDLKGKHPTDVIKHNIGKAKLMNDREWSVTMQWAEVGKTAVMFHNGGASETCIGQYWHQAYNGGEWWNQSHGEPYLLRSYCGNVDKLIAAVKEIQAGREVVVPCMVDGDKNAIHMGTSKIQRLKASLKLQDYNPKRDFVGWGGEDFRRIQGMPGFTHYSALTRVDPEALSISAIDFDADGKPDLCLVGAGRLALFQNGGESFNEVSLPNASGARAAVWADYNGDGLPDLLLATPTGPKLYTNLGKHQFRDDSHLLPREPGYNLTAAVWIDYDGDGRPDILLGNGFHGLRLYRNVGAIDGAAKPMGMSKWQYIGPFPNPGNQGFAIAYPPEKGIDLKAKYPGKNGEEAVWKPGEFNDGTVNNLALFKPENNTEAVVYLYREIETSRPMDLPVSFGSDDTLTVWLNGQQVLAVNEQRGCQPDQNQAVLKLKEGKNQLLLKICQGGGEWAFYFQAKDNTPPAVTWRFEDVSVKVGLGPDGLGSTVKGDTLTVCDVNGDGRPDFLYGAGTGLLLLNTPEGFKEAKASGIVYKPGKVGPVFGDFDNSGHMSLFVPQLDGSCKLFKNDGQGHFQDVTAKAGDLGKPMGMATCAAWGDIDNDGHLDLVVGCLRGPNRFFRSRGDGTFEDATEKIGLHQKIFNTQGVCLVDLNKDGQLDMVFNNEGQDSCILLGNPALPRTNTPVILALHSKSGVVGSKVRVLDSSGRMVASHSVSGGDGRGGQQVPHARFALKPGTYRVEVRYSSGKMHTQDLTVAGAPMQTAIEEK
jgi:hypothetical protein